jgi:hypothetical protein
MGTIAEQFGMDCKNHGDVVAIRLVIASLERRITALENAVKASCALNDQEVIYDYLNSRNPQVNEREWMPFDYNKFWAYWNNGKIKMLTVDSMEDMYRSGFYITHITPCNPGDAKPLPPLPKDKVK